MHPCFCMPTSPRIIGMIPARLGSTRFPEKVLASATGKPLIQHVYENAKRASRLQDLVIATDHDRVADACMKFGAKVLMTDAAHPNGSSRLAQAACAMRLGDDDIIVNVQGDEPDMEPAVINACVDALTMSSAEVATVGAPWNPADDPGNPAIVKVVTNANNLALYFSRSRIPYPRDPSLTNTTAGLLRHVGLYAYRNRFLQTYITLPPTPLEMAESLEQLRVLEHGYRIAVAIIESKGTGIDTPEQYQAFVARLGR